MDTKNHENRVLLLTPTGRDAALISDTLLHGGLSPRVCADVSILTTALTPEAGAAIIAEEALNANSIGLLTDALRAQPPWSDLPLIVLSATGESSAASAYWSKHLGALGNVTVIERPVRPATMLSVTRAALRARQRQYEVHKLLSDLQLTEDRLRTIIESAEDYAIMNLDSEGRITYWNAGAERLFGYTEAAILGKSFEVIFTEDERSRDEPARRLAEAARSGRSESEGWRVRADGSRFWASGVLRQTRNGGCAGAGFVDVVRDITERKNTEEKLQRSNEDLQRFAYVASHDLQEPLRMIGSYSQLLARKNGNNLDEDSRQFVRFIVEGVERMRTLIRDLLDFSRLTSDNIQPPSPVPCHAILGLALQHLQFKISDTGAQITFDRLPVVLAHETRLLQVFQNIIGNAMKYCETTPRIHVSASRDGDFWRISIRDNGIGIAPEHQEKVFGLFQRLHNRTEYPGTGIGLATCKRIVEQFGGRIWVESVKGQGSTFYFTLPAAEETPMGGPAALPANAGYRG